MKILLSILLLTFIAAWIGCVHPGFVKKSDYIDPFPDTEYSGLDPTPTKTPRKK